MPEDYHGTYQYVSTRKLTRYLQTYPRLMKALSSIEVDFFISTLSDENQLLQDEPKEPTNEPRLLTARNMRLLLSEAYSLFTQARFDNLQSGLSLPGHL
ncbi:hypothetical protein AYI69_g172 [Smittium culicis]|uniref:Uncharacterized protein n=1 Tax=Smittium culicis TaxID=133412 RepID=A0A1R1YTS6_9FUNG|nr:hypothetical protein AYI69_g172 [Smittium culicis]